MPSLFDYPGGEHQPTATQEYLLREGSDQDWATLNRYTHSRRFHAGEVVISQGDSDRALYIVTDGVLEAVLPGRKGFRRLSTFEAGSVIGELSFFDGGPRSALVRALTDAELAMLTVDSFNALGSAHPALARTLLFDLGRILAGRLRAVQAGSAN